MTLHSAKKAARASTGQKKTAPGKHDDRDLIDSTSDKAEREGLRLARKIIASLESELGLT